MKWRFRDNSEDDSNGEDTDERRLKQVEDDLQSAEEKLAETRAKIPEISEAFRNAKKVKRRVDRFTAEYEIALRRLNHG